MKIWTLALLAAACSGSAADPCPSLAPVSAGQPATVTFASTGEFCLHLDTRSLTRAHLAIQTDAEAGATSSFALRLSKPDGTLLQGGWDVTVGDPARSFASLEWSPPAGTVLEVSLS